MADGQLRARLLPMGDHAERNLSPVARLYVEVAQRGRISLEVLRYLHDDVVLVELSEDG